MLHDYFGLQSRPQLTRKIILTAGHTGTGTGAWRQWFDEGSETIKLRNLITAELAALGVYVRNDSNHERLGNVIKWVNEEFEENDIFVELHFNAVDNPEPSGVECFIQRGATDFEIQLGMSLCLETAKLLGIPSRGIKTSPLSQHKLLAVTDRTKVQAVLWEVCFMSNESDVIKYQANQHALSKQIAQVLFNAAKQ